MYICFSRIRIAAVRRSRSGCATKSRRRSWSRNFAKPQFPLRLPLAEQALDLWISIYGAEAGNMALKVLASGGVFLAGGIAPKILPKLSGPLFMQAFLSKGRLQPVLEDIPVRVITNEKTGC
jgi:glucokinase